MLGGAFWRVICYWRHIDTYIVSSQRKKTWVLCRLIKKVVHWIRWSVLLFVKEMWSRARALAFVFTGDNKSCIVDGVSQTFKKREDLKISLVRVFSTQSFCQTGERCASRGYIPTCGSSVKTWYAESPFSLRRSLMLTRHTTLERS